MLCSAKEIIEELSGFSIVPDATAVKNRARFFFNPAIYLG
jgi:hypothetical protein